MDGMRFFRIVTLFVLIAASVAALGCASSAAPVKQRAELEGKSLELEKDILALREEMEALKKNLDRLEVAVGRLGTGNGELKALSADVAAKIVDASGRLDALDRKRAREASIKVLAGDGKLSSAETAAALLKKKGFNVKAVDYAHEKGDNVNTIVFFKPEIEDAAREAARTLGGGAEVRPLTWTSVFDIIVQTGNPK